MALNFPDPAGQTPANTFSPTSTPSASTNGVSYVWNGEYWIATDPASFLPISGGELTGDLTVPSLNGGQLAGFRNQIINGDFRVWQRGTSVTQGPLASGYGADRWCNVFSDSGHTLTYTQVTDHGFANYAYACRFTTTTDLTNARVRQAIELDAEGSAGKFTGQWTLSWTSSAQPQFVFVAFADNFMNVNGSSGWTQDAAGIVSLGNNRYSATFTADDTPNATNKCLLLTLAPPAGTGPWDLTGVQFEPGPVATPFEHRPLGTERALCERYYEKWRSSQYGIPIIVQGTYASTPTLCMVPIQFREVKRTRLYALTFDGVRIWTNNDPNTGTSSNLTVITIGSGREEHCTVYCNLSEGFNGTPGDWSAYISNGTITIDDEL